MNLSIDGDTTQEAYDLIKKYAKTIKGVEGLTCEIGVRRGLGSKFIVDGCLENDDKRTHICIDPYGNIIMNSGNTVRRHDHTNQRKCECISALQSFAFKNNTNIIFFELEDEEFFKRFSDGIPVYEEEKKIINKYAFVHVDGPHSYDPVSKACEFFVSKMDKNAILVFDNTDEYDHKKIEETYLSSFQFLEEFGSHKKFYRKL